MARILYGVVSVGFGHTIRSKVVIDYLKHQKHKVLIVTSNASYDYYKKIYKKDVYTIEGLELVFKKNSVLNLKTILKNLEKASRKTYDKLLKVRTIIKEFGPEVIISDMESFTSFLASDQKLPLISIDNQHYLVYGNYSFPKKFRISYLKALMIVKSIVLKAKYYMIMALPGDSIEDHVNVFKIKPLLRKEIMQATPETKDYIFVYQSTKSYDTLIDILKRINYKFIIYGFDKDKIVGNLYFKSFKDNKEYINDLAHSKAVITNGGFTLISESLYLSKPLLVVPIKKHFEQILNALYVSEHKYGEFYSDLDESHVVNFIMNLKDYRYTVEKWNNDQAFGLLDMLINKELK